MRIDKQVVNEKKKGLFLTGTRKKEGMQTRKKKPREKKKRHAFCRSYLMMTLLKRIYA